jgi:hypothetical protein
MWVLWLLLIGAFSAHDHGQHLNPEFVASEARRVAWLTLDELRDQIEKYIDTI